MDDTKFYKAGQTFTPSAPIDNKNLFSGRRRQVNSAVAAINQRGQHAIMYGERGVGKTSLANTLQEFLPDSANIYTVRVNCYTATTFSGLWKEILKQIHLRLTTRGLGFASQTAEQTVSLDYFLQNNGNEITPNDIRFVLDQIPFPVILIIDELDRIQSDAVIENLADTIKTLSDYSLNTTLILVGVADSVDELIKQHQSIGRALVQIHMPRMSREELFDVIDRGLKTLDMQMEGDIRARIVNISIGLPHYTHLLALAAVQNAIRNDRTTVTHDDFEIAIKEALQNTQESTQDGYYKAVTSPRGKLYPTVLLACAMAKADPMGYFSPADVGRALKTLTGKEYEIARFGRHLKDFCEADRGQVLVQKGFSRRHKYRFSNPLMQPFILMKGLSEGNITTDLLKENSLL